MKKYTEIGVRIKELRGKSSQPAFASKIGVSLQGYLNYEYGKRVPPGPVLAKIAAICNTTTDWILSGGNNASADRVAEPGGAYGLDDVTQRVVQMMGQMTKEDKREVLKYASFREQDAKKKLKEGA